MENPITTESMLAESFPVPVLLLWMRTVGTNEPWFPSRNKWESLGYLGDPREIRPGVWNWPGSCWEFTKLPKGVNPND